MNTDEHVNEDDSLRRWADTLRRHLSTTAAISDPSVDVRHAPPGLQVTTVNGVVMATTAGPRDGIVVTVSFPAGANGHAREDDIWRAVWDTFMPPADEDGLVPVMPRPLCVWHHVDHDDDVATYEYYVDGLTAMTAMTATAAR